MLKKTMGCMCVGDKPVHTTSDFKKSGIKVRTVPMSQDWKDNIKDRRWSVEFMPAGKTEKEMEETGIFPGSEEAKMYKLRDRLLSFAGEEACVMDEPDIDNILKYGQIWDGKRVLLHKRRVNHCHQNSCVEYEELVRKYGQENVGIATGYALSKDGMWRSHSWCMNKISGIPRVIETTEKRVLYYGVCMQKKDAKKFCNSIEFYC